MTSLIQLSVALAYPSLIRHFRHFRDLSDKTNFVKCSLLLSLPYSGPIIAHIAPLLPHYCPIIV